MESIKVYKNRALESLSGNWGQGVVATILYFIFTSLPIINLITRDLLVYGCCGFYLDIANGKRAEIGRLFDGFNDFLRVFLTMLLISVYIALWLLVLYVPMLVLIKIVPSFPLLYILLYVCLALCIVKWYSYSMTPFIMRDNPGIKYNAAINKSIEMMKGKKADLFLLDLSMIGWMILCVCTLGLGLFFLIPYVYTAHAHFYNDAKEEMEELTAVDDEA